LLVWVKDGLQIETTGHLPNFGTTRVGFGLGLLFGCGLFGRFRFVLLLFLPSGIGLLLRFVILGAVVDFTFSRFWFFLFGVRRGLLKPLFAFTIRFQRMGIVLLFDFCLFGWSFTFGWFLVFLGKVPVQSFGVVRYEGPGNVKEVLAELRKGQGGNMVVIGQTLVTELYALFFGRGQKEEGALVRRLLGKEELLQEGSHGRCSARFPLGNKVT
jgi:hypothetical protein